MVSRVTKENEKLGPILSDSKISRSGYDDWSKFSRFYLVEKNNSARFPCYIPPLSGLGNPSFGEK